MALTIELNGQPRALTMFAPDKPVMLQQVLDALELKADRIAVECNGEIAPRATWTETVVQPGSRLEIVHFVGGGAF